MCVCVSRHIHVGIWVQVPIHLPVCPARPEDGMGFLIWCYNHLWEAGLVSWGAGLLTPVLVIA